MNQPAETLIPIDFLIDRLGIKFKISSNDNYIVLMIKSVTKNLHSQLMLDKKLIEMDMQMGLYHYNDTKISIIEHYLIITLNKMFPHFNKLDIDYNGLEKYLEKDS
jgi:hypothetical protein